MQEYGRLSDLGLLQVLLSAFKHEVCNAETQHFIGLFKQFFGLGIVVIQVLAHTHKLCALTRKYECFHCLIVSFIIDNNVDYGIFSANRLQR